MFNRQKIIYCQASESIKLTSIKLHLGTDFYYG